MLKAINATEECAKSYSPIMTTYDKVQKAKQKKTDTENDSTK